MTPSGLSVRHLPSATAETLSQERDRWFESGSLQRRIGNEPVRPRLAEDRLSGPRGSPLKGYISISYEDLAAFWRLSRGYDFAGKLKSVAFR